MTPRLPTAPAAPHLVHLDMGTRIVGLFTLFALLALDLGCARQARDNSHLRQRERLAVGVLAFEGENDELNDSAADGIIAGLSGANAPQVTVIERRRLDRILEERQLAAKGIVAGEDTAVLGTISEINALFLGKLKINRVRNDEGKEFCPIDAQVRLVDTTSGAILWSENQNGMFYFGNTCDNMAAQARWLGEKLAEAFAQDWVKARK